MTCLYCTARTLRAFVVDIPIASPSSSSSSSTSRIRHSLRTSSHHNRYHARYTSTSKPRQQGVSVYSGSTSTQHPPGNFTPITESDFLPFGAFDLKLKELEKPQPRKEKEELKVRGGREKKEERERDTHAEATAARIQSDSISTPLSSVQSRWGGLWKPEIANSILGIETESSSKNITGAGNRAIQASTTEHVTEKDVFPARTPPSSSQQGRKFLKKGDTPIYLANPRLRELRKLNHDFESVYEHLLGDLEQKKAIENNQRAQVEKWEEEVRQQEEKGERRYSLEEVPYRSMSSEEDIPWEDSEVLNEIINEQQSLEENQRLSSSAEDEDIQDPFSTSYNGRYHKDTRKSKSQSTNGRDRGRYHRQYPPIEGQGGEAFLQATTSGRPDRRPNNNAKKSFSPPPNTKAGKSTAANYTEDNFPKPAWMIERDAIRKKLAGRQWNPRTKLSPAAVTTLKLLKQRNPNMTVEEYAPLFKMAPDAIRRIFKSNWMPSPEKEEERMARWQQRGNKIWQQWVEEGIVVPKSVIREQKEARKEKERLERERMEQESGALFRKKLNLKGRIL